MKALLIKKTQVALQQAQWGKIFETASTLPNTYDSQDARDMQVFGLAIAAERGISTTNAKIGAFEKLVAHDVLTLEEAKSAFLAFLNTL